MSTEEPLAGSSIDAVTVRSEILDGVALLTLSYPARRNALNQELSRLLADAVAAAVADVLVGLSAATRGQSPYV